jgi:hypothetical protein
MSLLFEFSGRCLEAREKFFNYFGNELKRLICDRQAAHASFVWGAVDIGFAKARQGVQAIRRVIFGM